MLNKNIIIVFIISVLLITVIYYRSNLINIKVKQAANKKISAEIAKHQKEKIDAIKNTPIKNIPNDIGEHTIDFGVR